MQDRNVEVTPSRCLLETGFAPYVLFPLNLSFRPSAKNESGRFPLDPENCGPRQ